MIQLIVKYFCRLQIFFCYFFLFPSFFLDSNFFFFEDKIQIWSMDGWKVSYCWGYVSNCRLNCVLCKLLMSSLLKVEGMCLRLTSENVTFIIVLGNKERHIQGLVFKKALEQRRLRAALQYWVAVTRLKQSVQQNVETKLQIR